MTILAIRAGSLVLYAGRRAAGRREAAKYLKRRGLMLGRYEVHLDRKLEHMLTMLLRLKDLRQGVVAG